MDEDATSMERDELLARLPFPANADGSYPLPSSEVYDLFTGISTDAIREMSSLNSSRLSNAITGIRHCEWDETILRDYCQLAHLSELWSYRIQHLTDRLKSLQFYDHLTPQQSVPYPKERVSQATAIMMVAHRQKQLGVNGWYLIGSEPTIERYPYIDDAKLRELLLVSDYDREKLVDFILERDIFDGEALSHLLEDSHSAITGGVL